MKTFIKYISVLAAGLLAFQGIAYADGNDSTVKLYKKIDPTADEDIYTITLEAFVTGESTTKETWAPMDAVLVLDVSTSMSASQGETYLLNNPVQLTTGDNIGILHTTTSGVNNYFSTSKGRLRYQIKIGNNTYNLIYRNNKWYYGPNTTWNAGGWNEYKRNNSADVILTDVKIDLLQQACRTFVNLIKEKAKGPDGIAGTEDDVDHRLGFATFCGNLMQYCDIVPIGDNLEVTTRNVTGTKTMTVDDFIDDLFNHQGSNTQPNQALNRAVTLFSNLDDKLTDEGKSADERKARSKVTVMFTDGEPTNSVNDNLASAVKLKAQFNDGTRKGSDDAKYYGKLYTVGIFSNSGKMIDNNSITITNYMTYMSSEYPNATSKTNRGSKDTRDDINYYQESDGANLSSIFESIARETSADVQPIRSTSTALVDIVSTNFTIPEDASNLAISVWKVDEFNDQYKTQNYYYNETTKKAYYCGYHFVEQTGYTPAPTSSIDVENNKLTITNFDYAKPDGKYTEDGNGHKKDDPIPDSGNWVGPRKVGNVNYYWGRKIVITFDVKLNPDYEGGYGMPSNDIKSGLYIDKNEDGEFTEDEVIEYFTVPSVTFPSICIMKDGLEVGESAVFEVYRGTVTADSEPWATISLTQRATASGAKIPCFVVLKDLEGGSLTVVEKDWAWLATPSGSWPSITQTLVSAETMGITAAQITDDLKCNNVSAGKQKTVTGTAYNGVYCLINNSEGNTVGSAISLLYHFFNTRSTSGKPLRAEGYVNNEFKGYGNTGGTEYGGNEEEEI